MQVKPVRRATGRSATAAAAYRSASEIPDERTGEEFDYTRKQGVEHSEIVLPSYAARHDINWARDRTALWNAAELAEKRKDSRVAREYEIALPAELSTEQRLELTREFARYIADRHGCAVDIAIHAPHRQGDERNHHAHLLATTRRITPTGLGEKTTIELSDTNRKKRGLGPAAAEIREMRERWAQMSNAALERHGHDARVDHRTLAAQRQDALQRGDTEKAAELDREPTKHLGVAATALERKGQSTDLGEFNRRIAEAAEAGRLQQESKLLDQSILDLSTDLAAALKERDRLKELQRSVQPDGELALEVRRKAREAWEARRAASKEVRAPAEVRRDPQQGGPARDALAPSGLDRAGPGTGPRQPGGRESVHLGGFKPNQVLFDRLLAIGGKAADPRDLARVMREWVFEEERKRQQHELSAGRHGPDAAGVPKYQDVPGGLQGRPGPLTPRPQVERDRQNEPRPHRDRGLDR